MLSLAAGSRTDLGTISENLEADLPLARVGPQTPPQKRSDLMATLVLRPLRFMSLLRSLCQPIDFTLMTPACR